MYSLFWKIFVWFWLTVVIVGVTMVVTAVIGPSRISAQREARAKLSIYLPLEARRSAEVYEREGKTGLQNHFDGLRESVLFEPYFFDTAGNELLEHNPGPRALEFANAATEDAPRFSDSIGRGTFAAQQVTGPSGHRYTILVVLYHASFLSLLRGLGFTAFLRLLAVLLVGGILCWWLTRNITRPVARLSEVAGRIADGQLGARSENFILWRRDEIGGLARSFDRMANRIESLVEAQQRLLGDVSHELRSPLTRLSLALGLLRQCSRQESAEYLDRIELETQHLDKLIGQLLTLARIDSNAESSQKERIELTSLLQEVAADGTFEARARHCTVSVASGDTCTTTGVTEQLRRALENVVRNAIRYTKPSTAVEISMRQQGTHSGSRAVIQVRDHGLGVPAVHLAKIFRPFYRVPNVDGAETAGAGLGLAITERIVRMHGGRVRASNVSGGGLLVELELPLTE
jgi:two-component system sensor histidine kinase CpxA